MKKVLSKDFKTKFTQYIVPFVMWILAIPNIFNFNYTENFETKKEKKYLQKSRAMERWNEYRSINKIKYENKDLVETVELEAKTKYYYVNMLDRYEKRNKNKNRSFEKALYNYNQP